MANGTTACVPATRPPQHEVFKLFLLESLAYFEEHGGYCDCEVLMNVDPYEDDTAEEQPSTEWSE
jgi:Protein of unknown function (DUF2695)